MRAAIYLRISKDRDGRRAGVERQRDDCLKLCAERGWTAEYEFEDNDISAYSGRQRPGYGRLVADVAAGHFDVVVAWHPDRLWRSVIDQQMFLAVAREAGLRKVVTVTGGEFDPGDADDDFMSTIQAAVAQKESADKARRIKRAQLEKARRGEWIGGPRSFGYESDGRGSLRIVAKEAREIRAAARHALAGESIRSIVLDLNRRGVETVKGAGWRQDTVAQMLQSARIAGLVEYDGEVFPGQWKPIIDLETHRALRAAFEARRRGTKAVNTRIRKHLLTGMLRCSKCGSKMGANPLSRQSKRGGVRYLCKAPGSGGCAGTTVKADYAEATVVDAVMDYVDSREFEAAVKRAQRASTGRDHEIEDVSERLARDRARLETLGNDYADGLLDRAEYRRLSRRLQARIGDDERWVAADESTGPAATMAGQSNSLREAWPRMTVVERREVLDALIEEVVVLPATPPMNRWKPERLKIEWRF